MILTRFNYSKRKTSSKITPLSLFHFKCFKLIPFGGDWLKDIFFDIKTVFCWFSSKIMNRRNHCLWRWLNSLMRVLKKAFSSFLSIVLSWFLSAMMRRSLTSFSEKNLPVFFFSMQPKSSISRKPFLKLSKFLKFSSTISVNLAYRVSSKPSLVPFWGKPGFLILLDTLSIHWSNPSLACFDIEGGSFAGSLSIFKTININTSKIRGLFNPYRTVLIPCDFWSPKSTKNRRFVFYYISNNGN